MRVKKLIRDSLNSIFKKAGHQLVPMHLLYEWQKKPIDKPLYKKNLIAIPEMNYLQPSNPRLKELEERYARFNGQVTIPLIWKSGHVTSEDLVYFRGDNAYVYQLRGQNMNSMGYTLTTYYVETIDRLFLLDKLMEDDLFGIFTFEINGKKISRDLLDSIIEIHFLDKYLKLSSKQNFSILDIGAGYGRLAHRMANALPGLQTYYCTDAFASSTFISEFYLRFRNVTDRTKVVSLDEIENTLKNNTIELAVNIHSFSECTTSAIEWWVSLLHKYRVRYLLIVPNSFGDDGESFLTYDRKEMMPFVEKNGYKLIVKEPKYADPQVQKYAVNPTYFYLFELKGK